MTSIHVDETHWITRRIPEQPKYDDTRNFKSRDVNGAASMLDIRQCRWDVRDANV